MENKEIYGYIYLITNKINGKQYVGQTIKTIKKRFKSHCSNSKQQKTYIGRAINKYGRENFKVEELAIAYNQKELIFLEGMYMSWFNTLAPNGYNLAKIINVNSKHSKESIEKMIIAQNRPEKLKIASEQGKKHRGKIVKNSTSKYIGVVKRSSKYISRITFNNEKIYIGIYDIETDAAKAYDLKALELFGLDCILNFPKLKEDYINGKIIVNKNTRQTHSTSGEKGIYFFNQKKRWRFQWFDKHQNKRITKSFKTLEEAIKFKNHNELNYK